MDYIIYHLFHLMQLGFKAKPLEVKSLSTLRFQPPFSMTYWFLCQFQFQKQNPVSVVAIIFNFKADNMYYSFVLL